MPYEIEIPGRAVVEVPDSVPLDVAQKHVSQQFPATGDEIAQALKEDPSYIPTKDQFKTFEKWRETKGTDWINSIAEGISGILSTATSAATEGATSSAALNPANYIEGIAQGFNQLKQVLTESQDPGSFLFNFKDWATGDGTESSRYDQFVQARKYNEQMAKYAAGEDTVLPKELVNPTFAQGVALFADPTMFLPAVGEALGVGKLATKVVGKATKAAGAMAEAVAKPIESGVSAVSRAITDASGMAPETMRSAGLSAGVASAVAGHPLIAGAAALPSLVSSGVDLAEAISRTGEGLATQPSRIGALEFAGTRPDASLRQKLLGVVGRYGGDTALDFGLRGAAGAVEGAAVGGALGAASGGQEGAAQGIGSGLAAGALGAVAGRALGQLTGKAALEARAGDLSRWIETISDPYQREQIQNVIKSKGVDTATGLMDMTRIIQGTLGDVPVMFFSKDDFNKQHGSGRGIALLQGDRPVIHISLDLTKGTKEDPFYNLAHEAFHVFDEAAQLSDKTSELKQALVGKYATDATGGRQLIHEGLLDPAEVQRRFQQYADHFQGEEKAKLDAMSPAEKSDFVASELGAEYFARMVRGYKTDSLLRGFTGASRQLADYALLQSASQSLSRIAGALERGFGVKPVDSVLFPDLKQASPQINAMLRTIVRTRNKLNEAISKADENPLILSKADLSNPIAAKMAVDGGMAKVDQATGKPVMLTKDEMLANEKQLFDSVLKVVAGTPIEDTTKPFARVVDGAIEGPLSQAQIKALVDSPLVPSQIKQKISAMNTLINEGRSAFINYGAATKKTKNRLTGQERTVYSSKIPVSMREGAFYDMRVSKAGNPYVRMLDLDKVRSALTRRYQSTGSFGPYTSMGEVVGDLAKFFNNLDKGERRQLSADLFGADKAEFLTNLVREKTPGGTASPFFRSIRLDRLISASPRDFVGKINPEIFSETFGRWMPSDAEYMSAVNSGDIATSQRMVDEAAKAAGYNVGPVGHGSGARFNEFKREFAGTTTEAASSKEAFFFTDGELTSKAYAVYAAEEGPIKALTRMAELAEKRGDWDEYERLLSQAEDSVYGDAGAQATADRRKNAVVYKVFIRGKFLEMDAKGETPATLSAAGDFAQFDGSITAAIKKAKRGKYDGVLIRNLDDAPGINEIANHWAVFSPSNIKLADPITRDDAGNVIPLSQRFNTKSQDIRWMPSKRVGEADVVESSHGFRIVKPDGRQFRLYGPDKALLGVFSSQSEAETKANMLTQSNNPQADWKRVVRRFQNEQWESTETSINGQSVRYMDNGGDVRFAGDGWWSNYDSNGELSKQSNVPLSLQPELNREAKRIANSKSPIPGEVYIRFGEVPKSGKSRNHVTGSLEPGVSVYRAKWNPVFESFELLDANHAGTAIDLMAQGKRPAFYSGRVAGIGSDGEPTLFDVKKLHSAEYKRSANGFVIQ